MRRLVVSAALVLVVAGCGGDPKADPTRTPSSPSTSVTPTATPPVMPEAAKANTKAGAVAFVRYYVDAFNFAQATGSSTELASKSSAHCHECRAVLQGLRRIYDAHGHIDGGSLIVVRATSDYNSAERVWFVLVQIESGPQTLYESADADPKRLPGGRRSMDFSVIHRGGEWKVSAWTRT
jgi:hypothetical protein